MKPPSDYRIVIRAQGGPEVLELEEISVPSPGPGEIRIRHEAVGLNFIDIYHRNGLYQIPLPSGIGSEGAGIVEEVGPDVGDIKPGDRIGYAMGPLGSYASVRLLPAAFAVPIPDDVPADLAAAIMLKGMTAEFLAERCSHIRPGETALVHAAAGGVGMLLVQWLKAAGVNVLAHVGNAAKAEAVRALGIDHISSAPLESVASWAREMTNGEGVHVVFDGVGAASWSCSLASVRRRGLIVSYGNASGPTPPVTLLELSRAGSIYVTRPTLVDYATSAAERRASAARLFDMIGSGAVKADVQRRFPLKEAALAHEALASRATTGSTVLIP